MTEPLLLVEHRGAVDHVTLNRPDRLNALNLALVDALRTYFEGLQRNTDTRIVVLKGAGRAFCAGLDMQPGDTPGAEIGHTGPRGAWEVQTRISDIYRAMRRCPQPIVSLVQGPACGGGFSLALASDIRILADDARMNAAYAKIGLTGCDMGSSYFLPRLVGASLAAELIYTGRFIHAEEALHVKLASKVVPVADLPHAVDDLVEQVLAVAPMGLRLSKQALGLALDAPSLDAALAVEDRHQALLSGTHDAREAVSAFLEKRPPDYRDS
ncbi:MAG: enoyl-CoA hydratase-related protein [Pseudomonadota bacterium]